MHASMYVCIRVHMPDFLPEAKETATKRYGNGYKTLRERFAQTPPTHVRTKEDTRDTNTCTDQQKTLDKHTNIWFHTQIRAGTNTYTLLTKTLKKATFDHRKAPKTLKKATFDHRKAPREATGSISCSKIVGVGSLVRLPSIWREYGQIMMEISTP